MKHKTNKKKPPSVATGSGKSENQSGGNVFSIQDNTTAPRFFQAVDFGKLADVLELHADLYRVKAEEIRIMAAIAAGGTVYPIRGEYE